MNYTNIRIKEDFAAANGTPTFTNGSLYEDETDGTYIQLGYAKIPIMDISGDLIGYEINNSVIQKQSADNYMYRLNTTYNFEEKGIENEKGTINVLFNLNIKALDALFPVESIIQGDIISGSGYYLGKTGVVTVIVSTNNTRHITIAIRNTKEIVITNKINIKKMIFTK